jgi:hypothetical protein
MANHIDIQQRKIASDNFFAVIAKLYGNHVYGEGQEDYVVNICEELLLQAGDIYGLYSPEYNAEQSRFSKVISARLNLYKIQLGANFMAIDDDIVYEIRLDEI